MNKRYFLFFILFVWLAPLFTAPLTAQSLGAALEKEAQLLNDLSDHLSNQMTSRVYEFIAQDPRWTQREIGIGMEGIQLIRMKAFEGMDEKGIDIERADILIERYITAQRVPWAFDTLKSFMKTLLTETRRMPK